MAIKACIKKNFWKGIDSALAYFKVNKILGKIIFLFKNFYFF